MPQTSNDHPSHSHSSPETVETPSPEKAVPAETSRIGKLKLAFLYVLIGGLASSAIVAVAALLIGDFNSAMSRSLLTIFILFTHSLLVLAVLWADKYNQVGRSLLPTSIVLLTLANLVTTTLGTWDIISNDTAWRALGLYFLILGAVFVIVGSLKLRVAQQAVQIAVYTSIGFIAATVIALAPWVLQVVERFDPLYFRVIAALSILTTTAFLITLILRGIALGRNEALHATKPKPEQTTGGLLAVYITLGVITSIVWCGGLTGLLVSGVQSGQPERSYDRYDNTYDSRDRELDRRYY